MKIMWHGVKSAIKTGYGRQTGLWVPRLQADGHEITINAVIDQYQNGRDENGVVNLCNGPGMNMGNAFILDHWKRVAPDITMSMVDPFVCEPTIFEKVNWYPWVMVDSEPLRWDNAEALKACKRSIAPTRHAEKVLQDAGFDPFYCPLAIDCDVYKPGSRPDARMRMADDLGIDLEGKFLVVMNAANHSESPSRKNFGSAFKAWAIFEKDHTDAVLYVHADIGGMVYHGQNLMKVAELYGAKNIVFAPQYEYNCGMIPDDWLADLYRAADVLLCTSLGEGFGLPIVEAQACGCPVIVPSFGAMQELVFDGTAAPGAKFMFTQGTEQFIVNEQSLAVILAQCAAGWDRDNEAANLKLAGQVRDEYHIETVYETHARPMLAAIEKEIAA